MTQAPREAQSARETGETRIEVRLVIDGRGEARVDTGIGFLDHMLTAFARHGLFDLELSASGDLHVDCHHVVEDVGLVLGAALKSALGERVGIVRFGDAVVPMDEALVLAAIDLSGRPHCRCELARGAERLGGLETETVPEFFRAVATASGMNLHLVRLAGSNTHHVTEAAFKAFAKALDAATRLDPRVEGVPSTKGVL
jgi:imidazoleglycerol-phosphate dehydratase